MSASNAIDPTTIPPHVAQQAVEWMVELQSSTDAVLMQRFSDWQRQHPDHERAWQRIVDVNASIMGASSTIGSAMAQVAVTTPNSIGRRRVIKLLSLAMFAGATGLIATETTAWRVWRADEQTGVGEYRTLTLADGTRLMLNTDSAVNIRFTRHHRNIQLLRGEILVETGRDSEMRPMLVSTRHGNLQPLGTRFNVRFDNDYSHVGVFEGRVAVRATALPNSEVVVMPGEWLTFNEHSLGDILTMSESNVAWIDNMIIASDTRLEDFVQQLGRHRKGIVRCDPALSELRISGTFPLKDTDLILQNLAHTLPLKVRYITSYWVTLQPA